jgi:hypothetical protein
MGSSIRQVKNCFENKTYLMNVKSGSGNQHTTTLVGEFLSIQPTGSPMNTNLKPNRSSTMSRTSIANFRRDASRRDGNIRAVTLEGRIINADHIFGAAKAVQESIDETFGETTHDAQLVADRKAYELRDNILNAFGRTESSSK